MGESLYRLFTGSITLFCDHERLLWFQARVARLTTDHGDNSHMLPREIICIQTHIWLMASEVHTGKRTSRGHVALASVRKHISSKPSLPDLLSRLCRMKKTGFCIWSCPIRDIRYFEAIQLDFRHHSRHFTGKRSVWCSFWGSGDRKYSKSSKTIFFANDKVSKEHVAAILTPKSHWGAI